MAATFSTTIGVTTVANVSRNDGYESAVVTSLALDAGHTTYNWTVYFAPEAADGTASSATAVTPTTMASGFTIDYEGAYLLRLVVDAGLPTEDTQYVRIRYPSKFGELGLVAGGEKNDGTAQIPVDIDTAGWSNDQNLNLQRLALYTRRASTSGRVLYVDHNRGRKSYDASQAANDVTNTLYIPGSDSADLVATGALIPAQAFADFSTINEAITYATNAFPVRGEPALSSDYP